MSSNGSDLGFFNGKLADKNGIAEALNEGQQSADV
jgi:hypothetical protein